MQPAVDYSGNGAYCYANCLHMCLRHVDPRMELPPGFLEALTLMPYGAYLVEDGDFQMFLASPSWNNPDMGVDLALNHLGWGCVKKVCPNREAATVSLADALRVGPVMLGPVDMKGLTYYPGQVPGPVTDHYVVALSAEGGRVVLHDPNRYPVVPIAEEELLAAWGAQMPYGQPYTLRYRFGEEDHRDRRTMACAAVASLRERAGWERMSGVEQGGVVALARVGELLADQPAASLTGSMMHFSLAGGARRCLDGATLLREAGLDEVAAAVTEKAYAYGRAQYEAARGEWSAVRHCFLDIAAAEGRFLEALSAEG